MQWDKVMEKCAYSNFKAITPKEFGNMEKQTKKQTKKTKKHLTFIESQSHRMAWLGGDLKDHQAPTLAAGRAANLHT